MRLGVWGFSWSNCIHVQPPTSLQKIFLTVLTAGNSIFAWRVERFINWRRIDSLPSPLIPQSIFIYPPCPMGSYINVHLSYLNELLYKQCLDVIYISYSIFHIILYIFIFVNMHIFMFALLQGFFIHFYSHKQVVIYRILYLEFLWAHIQNLHSMFLMLYGT